jgi:hypothetical protein
MRYGARRRVVGDMFDLEEGLKLESTSKRRDHGLLVWFRGCVLIAFLFVVVLAALIGGGHIPLFGY